MFHARSTAAALLAAVLLIAGCGGTSHPASKQPPRTSKHLDVSSAPAQSAMGSVHPAGWGSTPTGLVTPKLSLGAAPTGEMLDGIFVSDFRGLQPFAVAGYTAGFWPDYVGLHAAFPKAHAVSIAISARWNADCLDVEPGDASPSQAGAWVLQDIKAGFRVPCLYSDLSEMPAVKANLAAWLGSNWRARVFLWLAWYRFAPGLVAGYDAVQWTDKALGRNLDESTVSLAFLSIAQPPYTPPAPPKPKPNATGLFNLRVTWNARTGAWTLVPMSGTGRFGQPNRQASVELQLDPSTGKWRSRVMPWDAPPLGR